MSYKKRTEAIRNRLNEIKLPHLKLKKLEMNDIIHLDELGLDFTKKSSHARPVPKGGRYEESHYETVKEIFRYGTETFRDRVFILDKDKPRDKEFREYTYGDFREDVEALGTALTAKYMEKGAPLAIIGENQYDWYVSYMTALTGAGIAVPLDKELPDNEIEITLNRSKAEAVIFSNKLKDRILKLREKGRLPYVRTYVVMKSGDLLDDNVVGFDEVVREGKELIAGGDRSFIDTETDPDEFRALFFTSGTTSDAKGVMATSRQLANNINAVSAYVRINEQDRFFSVLPLHHTYESSIGYLLAVAYGSSIAVNQGLRYITQDLKDTRPSILIAVPLLIEHLYESIQKNIRKSKKEKIVESMMHTAKVLKGMGVDIRRRVFKEIYDGLGGNLEYIVSAAAPLDPKIGQWLTDLGIIFLQGYGLTETCPISAVTPEYDTRVGSAGKTIINGEIRVSNPDENGDGELVISTNTLMMGYFEDEAATNDAIEVDENGRRWFYSGDIGHVDEDGFVYITGRIKNVIVTQNGKNIYPEELEQLILENHDFSDCMVYGKEVPGEKELIVTARVIPNYDRLKEVYGDISTEEIYKLLLHDIRDVNKKTTNYKAIKNLEIKDGDYIRTSTKKIKRYREIKEGKILSISEPKGKV
ncbi:MAG: AMP-binding protein [Firmicutes bacterium]|nr:AMP-binding protein [Bacillota bacterium]